MGKVDDRLDRAVITYNQTFGEVPMVELHFSDRSTTEIADMLDMALARGTPLTLEETSPDLPADAKI